MRFCALASGSSGNSIYIGSDSTHILIDAGISNKRICEGLNGLDIKPEELSGILITHEHSDHIGGLKVFCKKYQIPIYATQQTLYQIKKNIDSIDDSLLNVVKSDVKLMVGDLTVNPIGISHDAVCPVGYRVSYGSKKMAVCTDLGKYDEYTVDCLRGLDVLLLEANHDIRMLQTGPYPYHLKQRILSDKGHLSNEASGQLLSKVLHDGVKKVFLGHLSQENNYPELAYEAVKTEVTLSSCNNYRGDDFDISIANRSEPSLMVEI